MEDEEIRTDMIPFGKDDCMMDYHDACRMTTTNLGGHIHDVCVYTLGKLIDSIAHKRHQVMCREVLDFLERDKAQVPKGELCRLFELLDQLVLVSRDATSREDFLERKKGSWFDFPDGYERINASVFTYNT